MARPSADLDAIRVPKGGEEAFPAPSAPEATAHKGYAHTLSLRLTSDDYRALRRYVAQQEEKTGRRTSHQALLERLLRDFLKDAS